MNRIVSYGKIKYALILMFIVLLVGVTGYMLIENDKFIDALYMTIITISTVGYGEIHTLSLAGRIFTICMISISWLTFAYAISVVTTYFVENELNVFFKTYKNKTHIKKMKNHIILSGYGRNGKKAAKELICHNSNFVVLEKNHELIVNNKDKNLTFIECDATEEESLINAGITSARALITTLPIDADNLFVVLTARSLNPDIVIVSRASEKSSEKKLKTAGANYVVLPESVGGEHMVSLVLKPDVVEFLDNISVRSTGLTNLEEIVCSNLPEDLRNHTIFELGIRKKTGANIVGFKTPEGEFIINPTPDTLMIPNAKLFVLGTPEQIKLMKDIFALK